jgi:hypothetical protein
MEEYIKIQKIINDLYLSELMKIKDIYKILMKINKNLLIFL